LSLNLKGQIIIKTEKILHVLEFNLNFYFILRFTRFLGLSASCSFFEFVDVIKHFVVEGIEDYQ